MTAYSHSTKALGAFDHDHLRKLKMGSLFDFLFGYEEPPDEESPEVDEEDLPHAPDRLDEVEGLQELNDRINENQTVGMEDGMDIEEADENGENEL
jgi:hypothetical protein